MRQISMILVMASLLVSHASAQSRGLGGALERLERPAPAEAGAAGETRHFSGLLLRAPANWKVRSEGGITFLTPPNLNLQRGTILVSTGPKYGAADHNDPKLMHGIEREIAGALPFMQRAMNPREFNGAAGSRGIMMAWEGTSQQGERIRMVTYMMTGSGHVVGLSALGERDAVLQRDAEVLAIAQSMRLDRPMRDPALVGEWHFQKTETHADSRAGFSMVIETNNHLVVMPDGQARVRTSSRAIGGNAGVGVDTGNDGVDVTGTIFSGDGQFAIISSDTIVAGQYSVENAGGKQRLVVTSDGKTWIFDRVR